MFRKCRFEKVSKQWGAVSQDEKLNSRQLAELLAQFDLVKVNTLAKLTVDERKRDPGWLKRFWLDSILVLCAAALIGAAVWNVGWLQRHRSENQAVVAARDLPAFHLMDAKDVKVVAIRRPADSFAAMRLVVGHYTARAIASGAVLRAEQLVDQEVLNGEIVKCWQPVTLPLKASPGPLAQSEVPGWITLIASPRSEKTNSELFHAILLQYPIADDPKSAVVALNKKDLKRFAATAGQSDFFVSRQLK